ncbi:glycosyltransferase family 2 protein [Rhizobium paknamense]|uniref:Succinoglycan biosynthesis protein ExoO n=1 Tax=Rhizobium paknamense TaxID=1206817 RepID=A0ABU0IJD7_9HYPH|nr:glycosyltransferase family 2 protein [Rhizobium paknamense]MDQ0458374.1 succinoglycan biosynthesis protein ExoO [Rhizobium paknamense]
MMQTGPDVSIIIAAYNAEETIADTLASVLASTGVSLEVVVADDCSKDRTREIVGAYPDPRVHLVALEKNKGPGGARNAAIAAATGRWIAVVDSDDTIRPDRLSRMIARAERASAQIAVDNLDVVELSGARRMMFPVEVLAALPALDLATFIRSNVLFEAKHNFGYMKPIFLRAFLLEKGLSFDEGLKIGEDYLLLASALAEGGVCVVEPEPGYIYNIREGSISRVLQLHHVDAMVSADRGFTIRYRLPPEALAAQRRRTRSLGEARAFIMLIDALKARSLPGVARAVMTDPVALRHLKMPIAVRLQRLATRFSRSGNSRAVPDTRPSSPGTEAPHP